MLDRARLIHSSQMAWALTKHHVRNIFHGDRAFLRVFNHSPAMIMLAHHERNLRPIHEAIGKAPGYFFFQLWGTKESPKAIQAIVRYVRSKPPQFAHHHYLFLCNSPEEVRLLEQAGVQVLFCNHNCWIDEALFCPEPQVEKCFDAIYDANIAPYKRHELAAGLHNLALISFRHPVMFNRGHAEKIRAMLAGAHWLNDPLSTDFRYLSNEEVVHSLRQSRVGLCLSASEGAMYASIQYLLCGLPVVSTPSRGGRDVFFEDDYVRITAETPRAIRVGVEQMINCPVPAEEIRRRTLEKIWGHRQRFLQLLQTLVEKHGHEFDEREEWPRIFRHKMGLEYRDLKEAATTFSAKRNATQTATR